MIVPLLPKLINNLGASRALAGLIGEYMVDGLVKLSTALYCDFIAVFMLIKQKI